MKALELNNTLSKVKTLSKGFKFSKRVITFNNAQDNLLKTTAHKKMVFYEGKKQLSHHLKKTNRLL